MDNKTLTALAGVKVGHSTHLDKLTGTTAVLFDRDFPMAYKSYGGSPGTFNTDALRNGRYQITGVMPCLFQAAVGQASELVQRL